MIDSLYPHLINQSIRALVAAAFAGSRFLRCIGIELLPSLCACATNAISRARNAVVSKDQASGVWTDVERMAMTAIQAGLPLLEVR